MDSMNNLEKHNQKKALLALQKVMVEFDISIEAGNYTGTCDILIGGHKITNESDELYDVNLTVINKLLSQS